MIKTCLITHDDQVIYDAPLQDVKREDVRWYWVDFAASNREETLKLASFFHFHPLSVEDCLDNYLQRPKIDFYEDYLFVVAHAVNHSILDAVEVNIFIGKQFIVTYHKKPLSELETIWKGIVKDPANRKGPFFVTHSIIDKLVDNIFPVLYRIEDQLNLLDDNPENKAINHLMEKLFDIRGELSIIRRTVIPMRDLMYRIIHSERLSYLKEQQLYFNDVYDHLLKLNEMLESFRDFSSDLRESYISINSNNMNSIMTTLTVITTIFMPLTFIVGVYGMNFEHMPELHWRYGYYIILGVMLVIAVSMFIYFKQKGWLRGVEKRRKDGKKT